MAAHYFACSWLMTRWFWILSVSRTLTKVIFLWQRVNSHVRQVPGGLLVCVLLLCYHMVCRTLVTVCTNKDEGSSAVARLLEQYIRFC